MKRRLEQLMPAMIAATIVLCIFCAFLGAERVRGFFVDASDAAPTRLVYPSDMGHPRRLKSAYTPDVILKIKGIRPASVHS